MKIIHTACTCLLAIVTISSAAGQKVDSYVGEMGEALVPFGTISSLSCHSVTVELNGPWANFAVPDGLDPSGSGTPTWTVLKLDLRRIYINLSELDEDKIRNQALFSIDYIRSHPKGTPYIADTPTVMFSTKGLNTKMTVNTVDLDRVAALHGKSHVTDRDLGFDIDERKFGIIAFSDQEHADVFQRALLKAIVLCKAQ